MAVFLKGAFMKSLMRWVAVLGLMGGVWVGPAVTGTMRSLALPEAQVVEKLRPVPVFTVTDDKGTPLIITVSEGDKKTDVASFFISQQDALKFVEQVKTKNPELAGKVRVQPVSLAEVYQKHEAQKSQQDPLEFAYFPGQQQVDTAMALLRQQGQEVPQFNGVPMFIATGGPEKGYLTLQQGNQQVIPIFFNKEDLQNMVNRFQQQQPELANQVQIKVVDLEGVIETLKTKNDPQLNQIVLIPPRESIEFLRSLPQGAGSQNAPQPAAPQPADGQPK